MDITHIGQQNLDTASSAKERSDLGCGYKVSTVRTEAILAKVDPLSFPVPTVQLLRFPSRERRFPVQTRSETSCASWIIH
jgi:hypothetical protein